MDQFLLFAGDQYEPSGGWKDFKGSFTTFWAAVEAAARLGDVDWIHIVDTKKGEIVREYFRK